MDTHHDPTTVGGRLREARDAAGLSPSQLAEKAGVAVSAIHMIERGQRGKALSAELAVKLVRALGCTVEHLIGAPPERPEVHPSTRIADDPTGPVVVRDGYDQTGTG